MRARIDWFVVVTAILFAFGCGGGGCGGCAGMEPIPGGFPSAKRRPNAGQVRVTQTALAKITADPAAVIGPLAGGAMNGVITFPIPASCSGTAICCPNGNMINNCGPIELDMVARTGDAARLALAPQAIAAPNGQLNITLRSRVKTKNDLVVTLSGTDCKIKLDTTAGSNPDLIFTSQVQLQQDGTTGTTKIVASNTNVTLEDSDYSITPYAAADFLCFGAAFVPRSLIEDQIAGMIEDQINEATCKACDSGNVAECSSPFATACSGGTCMAGNACLQELGLNGRLRGSLIFASLSPGTTGAMDMYEVAGGYSLTNNNGVSLGLLGGMEPGGSPRDRCGPPGTAPAPVTIPQSNFFQLNTRPDTNAVYDVGIGLHKSQLSQFAFAGYDGGLLCLTIGASTVAQLSTDTISLLSRSLGKLVEQNSPMAVGLRPQSPPTITLGKNTFKDDGSGNQVVDMPLLLIEFKAMEIDFFASVDEQYIRVFTVVSDVKLPIGLQVTGMGELTPVIGAVTDAFTNISVKNNEAITESPAELASLFPTLLELALPQLSSGLSPISLPELGGLALSVTDVTSVDGDNFLAIYANLVTIMPKRDPVDTFVEIAGVAEPADAIARDIGQWESHRPPAVTLDLSGTAPDLEFSWRINDGTWSAWSTNKKPTLTTRVFWLPGVHKVAVRSRQIGKPETIDPIPAVLEIPLGTGEPLPIKRAGFHGQAGSSGCNCETSSGGNGALLALVIGLVVLPRRRKRRPGVDRLAKRSAIRIGARRMRRRAKALVRSALRLGPIVWLAALAMLPGCSCGNPCGDKDCLPGEVARGAVGRFTSIAADDKRVMVATYDQVLGDLVAVDATDQANLEYYAVDGIPDGTPTYDPGTYRGGIEEPGPNVGAYTSIAMSGGLAAIAYQDRDEGSLKYAYETRANRWTNHVVDSGDAEIGQYASLVFDADKRPAIAYLAVGLDDGAGHRVTELRLARGRDSSPDGANDWESVVIASAPGSCGGLCGTQSCVVPAADGDPEVCVSPSSDCTGPCGDTEVCSAGTCREVVPEPNILFPPKGTGLYVSLVVLTDGRLAAAYYDQSKRALTIAVENGKGANAFTETILDGNAVGADRGMWSSAVADGAGTVHIAYQDALGDQLMYTTWNGAPGTPEIVDDGQRPGDRTHPVGAAASIYLVGGSPSIAYQDALAADVYVATKSGAWTFNPVASGPLLDGFSIGATTGKGSPVLAWSSMDPALTPPNGLVVRSP